MSRKPSLKPGTISREELLERRVSDLERMLRRSPARTVNNGADQTATVVTQTSHGLAVKNPIRHNGSAWVKSQADTAANAVVGGIVIAVLSPDVFVMATGGYVAGLSSLTAGSVHYLDASTAGALTTTAPSIAIPVLLADSTTSGVMLALGQGSGGSGSAHTSTSNPTVNDDSGDGYIIGTLWVNTSTDKAFIAADVTAGAAVWIAVGSLPADPSGAGWLLSHDGSATSWDQTVVLGNTSSAGSLTIANSTSASAIVLATTLINAAGKIMSVREIDVCDAGVAKKMLVLASAPY